MDYEKLHKDTIAKLQEMVNSGKITVEIARGICADFVPESEDEKIRKWLIGYFNQYIIDGMPQVFGNGLNVKDVIAWLEKQGEQKPVECCADKLWTEFQKQVAYLMASSYNREHEYTKGYVEWVAQSLLGYAKNEIEQKPAANVEPKFKVSDWISGYYTNYKVLSVNNDGYVVEDVDGNKINILFENEKFHQLWTIEDAKDGDVLSFDNEGSNYHSIGIFKRIANKNELNGNTYRCYVIYGGFKKKLEIPINGDELHHCGTSAHPATKEQRDQLEKAMADAGYTFDFEKKELKKIEQKPTWSEEDEEIYRKCICAMRASACGFPEEEKFVEQVDNWLKSIKDRLQVQPQTKHEWSEEDENIIVKIKTKIAQCNGFNKKNREEVFGLIDSLRPQSQWKPSDEQIKVCKKVYADLLFAKSFDIDTINSELNRLEEQLKTRSYGSKHTIRQGS